MDNHNCWGNDKELGQHVMFKLTSDKYWSLNVSSNNGNNDSSMSFTAMLKVKFCPYCGEKLTIPPDDNIMEEKVEEILVNNEVPNSIITLDK